LTDGRDHDTGVLPDHFTGHAAQRTEHTSTCSNDNRVLLRKLSRSGYLIEKLGNLGGVAFLLDRGQDRSNGGFRGGRIDTRLDGDGIDKILNGR
jgi:hypothetical protein